MIANILIGLLAVVVVMGVFLGIIWAGFRMGRMSAGAPVAPIIKPKVVNLVEEDPYYEPMHGSPQPNISTGADR